MRHVSPCSLHEALSSSVTKTQTSRPRSTWKLKPTKTRFIFKIFTEAGKYYQRRHPWIDQSGADVKHGYAGIKLSKWIKYHNPNQSNPNRNIIFNKSVMNWQWLKYTFWGPGTLLQCGAPCFVWGPNARRRPLSELLSTRTASRRQLSEVVEGHTLWHICRPTLQIM